MKGSKTVIILVIGLFCTFTGIIAFVMREFLSSPSTSFYDVFGPSIFFLGIGIPSTFIGITGLIKK